MDNDKIEFDYNHGIDFAKSSVTRYIHGVANKNSEGYYEYVENIIDGPEYKIVIEYEEGNGEARMKEYKDGQVTIISGILYKVN